MKRDWKLIRAIVREEDTSTWSEYIVLEHKALCIESGYIRASAIRPIGGQQIQIVQYGHPWQTFSGLKAAEMLANYDDLEAVIRELEEKNVGTFEEIVFEMMKIKARSRIGL